MQINKNNFDKMSLLLASYSFDARLATSSTGVTCRIPGCRFLSFKSTFPDIGKMDQSWIAAWTAPVSPQTGNVVMADIDNTGYVKQGPIAVLDVQGGCMCGCPFFVGSRCAIGSSYSILPGLYQVSIQVSSSLVNGPSTPVDFMLNVLAATYDSGHMRLLNKDTFWVNQYIPDSDIVGSFRTLQLGGVVEMVSPSLADARSLRSFLYPQIVQTYANFETKLTFVGSDWQKDINGNIDTKNTRVSLLLVVFAAACVSQVVSGLLHALSRTSRSSILCRDGNEPRTHGNDVDPLRERVWTEHLLLQRCRSTHDRVGMQRWSPRVLQQRPHRQLHVGNLQHVQPV